jgi:hypothetical protein
MERLMSILLSSSSFRKFERTFAGTCLVKPASGARPRPISALLRNKEQATFGHALELS